MKKELGFTKVHDNGRQRFYKLSIPVTKAPNPKFDWGKEKEYNTNRLKEGFKKFLTDNIEYVSVSDASTHVERLLFVAIPVNEAKTEFGCLCGLQLDGKHTMMIHGGNSRDVHPDEVYLRRLAKANGYSFKRNQEAIPGNNMDRIKNLISEISIEAANTNSSTPENAREYLISQGIDPESVVKRGLDKIRELKK